MPNQTIIGIIAGVFTSVSLIPQVIKIIKEKKAKDVSIIMLLILMTGNAIWIYYGILKKDLPIIITNSFSLLVDITTFILKLIYK